MACDRVKERVRKGGHSIPKDVIMRRYYKGISNLFKLFMNEVDVWAIYDNSEFLRERIAFGGKKLATTVNDNDKFCKIKGYVI